MCCVCSLLYVLQRSLPAVEAKPALRPATAKWYDPSWPAMMHGSPHSPGGRAVVLTQSEPRRQCPWTPRQLKVGALLNSHQTSCYKPSTAEMCVIDRQLRIFKPLRYDHMRH